MILETSGWRHLKEKNKLFLSYEYQKMYHPTPKTELPKLNSPKIEKTKDFKSFLMDRRADSGSCRAAEFDSLGCRTLNFQKNIKYLWISLKKPLKSY